MTRIDESHPHTTETPNHEAVRIFSAEPVRMDTRQDEAGTSCVSSTVVTAASYYGPNFCFSKTASVSSITDSYSDSDASNDTSRDDITHINQRAILWKDGSSGLILRGNKTYRDAQRFTIRSTRPGVVAEKKPSSPLGTSTLPPHFESPLWAEAKHLLELMRREEEQDEEFSMDTRTSSTTTSSPSSSVYAGDQKLELLCSPTIQGDTSYDPGRNSQMKSEFDSESIGDSCSEMSDITYGDDCDFAILAVG